MSNRRQVGEAIDVARSLVNGEIPVESPLPALVGLASRFAETEFDVPDDRDADAYLFQYGKASWFPEPTFVLSMVRQLEVVDANGEHEYYSQVQFEYRYPLDTELEAAGSHSEWWFPGAGEPLGSWLNSVLGSPIASLLEGRQPREFSVWKDQA